MGDLSGRRRRGTGHLILWWVALLATYVNAQNTPSLQRWGQAAAYIPSPPCILLHGGKTDPGNGLTYTSAPNSADTLLLSLSSSFASSSAPDVITVDAPNSPAYAWHTLTPFSTSDGKWDLLSFGGDAPIEAVQTGSDSAWYLDLDPSAHTGRWQRQATGWGNQPARRIYHSAAGHGDKVYLTGGLKNDGSGQAYTETYIFDPSQGFTATAPLPRATYHHASVLLPNGTLVVFGGVAIDMSTGMPAARPLSTIAVLDTTKSASTWLEREVTGSSPQARRGMASAVSNDGKTVFIHGGASTTFSEAYSDAWTLDLDNLAWTAVGKSAKKRQTARQAIEEPGARYDHAAVMASGGQVIILGGYGGDSVADPGPYVYNLPEGTWSSDYTPTPALVDPLTGTTASGSSPASPVISQSQSNPASTPVDASAGRQSSLGDPVSGSNTASSPSSSSRDSQIQTPSSSGMGLPAQLGLIFGILAVAGVIIALLIWRHRRRKRQQRRNMSIYGFTPAQPPSRPYGSRVKGGEGLMEEARLADEKAIPPLPGPSPPPKQPGLAFGNISSSLASLRGYMRKSSESYAALNDASPARRPTRKVGNGIRLIGPRSPPTEEPLRPGNSITTLDSRRDMLSDEDSRNFPPGVEDWEVGDISRGRWRSAQSILASHAENPFEDDEGDGEDDGESLRLPPVIPGGPVPTPHDSRTNLDPFDETHSRDLSDRSGDFGLPHVHSDPLLDLDGLLPPPTTSSMNKRFSGISMMSGPSTAMTDREEGVVHQAQYASPGRASSIVSPAETSYVPIKRTDTFFRRMTSGGISSLLSSPSKSLARSQSSSTSLYDIRDPAPPPSLWPVVSRDMLKQQQQQQQADLPSGTGTGKPPTGWKGGNLTLDTTNLQRPTHHPGPSLTSITSAKSMRDMVIVQREPTSSSGESAVIEHTPTEHDSPLPSASEAGEDEIAKRVGVAPSVPGSVVFDGADFAMSPLAPVPIPSQPITPPDGNNVNAPIPIPLSTPSSGDTAPITPPRTRSQVPSGSPIPHPLLSHRRPVSEMVKSINKRGAPSAVTDSPRSSLFSPASQYSHSPTSTPPRLSRPTTLYEAVKRDKLLVTNPDGVRR